MSQSTIAAITDMAGKYLTFFLAKEEYGIEILKIKEIIGMMDITELPRTPDFVKGVINLRGKVIPIIDLRLKFGMTEVEHTEKTCIIVVDIKENGVDLQIGIIVDSVSEVLNVATDELEDTPSFGADVNTDFILGMAKSKDKVRTLLEINKVLSTNEINSLG